MTGFDEWLDGIAAGKKPTVESFAATALTDLPRIETPIRYPNKADVWPPETFAEMERIRRGEVE